MGLQKRKNGSGIGTLLVTLITAAVFLMLVWAVFSIGSDSREKGRERLEEAARHAAVACYASEGVFPESIEYLEEHYGLQVDRDLYTVHYMIFAENIMPVIKVTEKSNG